MDKNYLFNTESCEQSNTLDSSDHNRPVALDSDTCDPLAHPLEKVSELDLFAHRLQAIPEADSDQEGILHSFDMVFRLQQRSHEMLHCVEALDDSVLNARSVLELGAGTTEILERRLDLVAARLLFWADHAITVALRPFHHPCIGVVPEHLFEHECFTSTDPFIIDDPSGALCQSIFGDSAMLMGHVLLASLAIDGEDYGILCLGSAASTQYMGGMNESLVASIARKLTLGIRSAWAHECASTLRAPHADINIGGESFFEEILHHQFQSALRHGKNFSLMAISWSSPDTNRISDNDITLFLRKNLRSSDVLARSEEHGLWALLPETDAAGSGYAAERLQALCRDYSSGPILLKMGITEFTDSAPHPASLMAEAEYALHLAEESGRRDIVTSLIKENSQPDDPRGVEHFPSYPTL